MAQPDAPPALQPITADDHVRFHSEAPDMLARRTPAWLAEQAWAPLDPALAACVSLAGLAFFGWPALAVLGFSLACWWNSLLCDLAKLLLARRAVAQAAQEHDRHVAFWYLAAAIRERRSEVPPLALGRYNPGQALTADFLLGLFATCVIVVKVADEAIAQRHDLVVSQGTWLALAITLGLQWLATIATVVRHRAPGTRAPLRFAAGARGFGLLALGILGLVLQDKAGAMLFAVALNVGLLALAGVRAWNWRELRAETAWVRRELAAPGAQRDVAAT